MKKLLIITILFISVFLTGCTINRYDKYLDANKYQTGNFTYNKDDVKNIEINWVSGGITIVGTTSETLNVTENSEKLDNNKKMHYYLDGNTLRIEYAKSKFFGRIDSNYKKMQIEVPENIAIKINSVSADIEIKDVTSKSLILESVSGHISISDLSTQKIEIEEVSGNMDINRISAIDIDISTVSSNVIMSVLTLNNMELETVSGNVEVLLLSEFGFTLDYETVSGEFTTELPCTKEGEKYKYLDGKFELDIETVSGNLKIKKGE